MLLEEQSTQQNSLLFTNNFVIQSVVRLTSLQDSPKFRYLGHMLVVFGDCVRPDADLFWLLLNHLIKILKI